MDADESWRSEETASAVTTDSAEYSPHTEEEAGPDITSYHWWRIY